MALSLTRICQTGEEVIQDTLRSLEVSLSDEEVVAVEAADTPDRNPSSGEGAGHMSEEADELPVHRHREPDPNETTLDSGLRMAL